MSLGICSLLMTEEDDMDDEAETSPAVRSRFAKFESPDDIDTDESADTDTNDDDDALSDDETTADVDSTSDFASDTDTDTHTTTPDAEEHITNNSRSTRVWSDATITDTTDADSDSVKTESSSDDRLKTSDDMSDSAVSTGSDQHSIEPATDRSQRDSDRIWNQPSGSDSPDEANTPSNQNKNSSVNIDQTDIPEEIITDSNQNKNTSVNTDQTDYPVTPQSQSQQSSSLTDNTSAESIQSDSSTVSDGSQALLLGEDNSQTWNAGFNHILETQHPQNLLLLVPAGETVDILRACQEHPSWDGGEIIIIKVGASVPGDMSVAELSGDGMDESIETHQISDQTDLSRLGILITQVLDNWQNPDQNTVCSVHTLQAFLQYLSPQKVFQFLYTLSRRLQSADIETTYLLTPSDGDRTVNTLRPIFDTVIET